MQYTQAQFERARAANLEDYLRGQGYMMKKSGSEWMLDNPKGVTVREGEWFDHYNNQGGGALEFLTRHEGCTWVEAVFRLSERSGAVRESPRDSAPKPQKEKKPFRLPEAAPNCKRVIAYLHKTRGIDLEIVLELIKKRLIYESQEFIKGKEYHNCVFVGKDMEGVAWYAGIRGATSFEQTPFRRDVDGSSKYIPFRIEGAQTSNTVYVFEAPIDLLSHATIAKRQRAAAFPGDHDSWRFDHRISLGCAYDAALEWYLHTHPRIERIIFCLDNDETGAARTEEYLHKYGERGYETGYILTRTKDWNDDLRGGTWDADPVIRSFFVVDNGMEP